MSSGILSGSSTFQFYDPIFAEPTAPRTESERPPAPNLVQTATVGAKNAIATILGHFGGVPEEARFFVRHTVVSVPPPQPRVTPRLQEMIREVRLLTGWSERGLATRIGISHPTIAAAASGSSQAFVRSPQAYARLDALYSVVTRIAPLARGGPVDVERALITDPAPGRVCALANLEENDLPGAYLAALDVLRPPRSIGKMQRRVTRTAGNDTAALTD